MKFIARLHPFLILAVVTVICVGVGFFWTEAFHDDAVGGPRAFYRIWNVVTTPLQIGGAIVAFFGLPTTRPVAILLLAVYVFVLFQLDRAVSRGATTAPRRM